MHILLISPPPDGKGPVSKFTPILKTELGKLNNKIDTVHRVRNDEKTSFINRVEIRVKDFFKIRPFLNKGYDLIVLNTTHDYKTLFRDLPLLIYNLFSDKNIALQFHGSDLYKLDKSKFFKWLTGVELKMSAGGILLSSEETKIWQKHWPKTNFQIVHNPLPPMPEYSKNKKEARPVFLFAGRIIREKGVFELVEAFKQVSIKKDCKLIIAGDGLDLEDLKEVVKKEGLDKIISFPGHVTGKKIWSLYQKSFAFVFPSFWPEGQPTVLMEAAHFGLPIVATNIRAVKDIFKDGLNGYFLPLHRPDLFAVKMTKLIDEPDIAIKMQRANLQLIKNFTPDRVATEYLKALKTFSRS